MNGIDDDNLRAELNALIDGALSEERAKELFALLDRDAGARREYESLRRVVEAVRALPREPAPPELRRRLAAVTAQRGRVPILRWAAPLAAAAAVVVAVLLVTRREPGTSLPDQARAEKKQAPPAAAGAPGPRPEKTADGYVRDDVADDADAEEPEEAQPEEAQPPAAAESEGRLRKQTSAPKPAAKAAGARIAGSGDKDPVAAVRSGAPIATSADLKAYLRALAGRKRARIVEHIVAFGVAADSGARKTKAKAATGPSRGVAPLSARLADKEEARLVSGVLGRAFPLAPSGVKQRGVLGGGANSPSSTATVENREDAKLILQVRATPLQAKSLRGWLARLSVATRAKRAGVFPRARPSGGFAGAAPKPERLRVELHYPPPKDRRADSDD